MTGPIGQSEMVGRGRFGGNGPILEGLGKFFVHGGDDGNWP